MLVKADNVEWEDLATIIIQGQDKVPDGKSVVRVKNTMYDVSRNSGRLIVKRHYNKVIEL